MKSTVVLGLALYYAEGSMKPKGREAVGRYLTRVMEVYVNEDGGGRRAPGTGPR